ncbi:hypothetical protein BLNAU_22067 [Blattamonas nauphoetae]|uniref:Uncharacterized protein n=1 Tax=Blattamonas nauphoetae TaxID=2049346 RepID=A0ABQ9WU56_9EUKA|nr:hypothetical protein BLNAU_22067 [Blattamonas nauphoetae]
MEGSHHSLDYFINNVTFTVTTPTVIHRCGRTPSIQLDIGRYSLRTPDRQRESGFVIADRHFSTPTVITVCVPLSMTNMNVSSAFLLGFALIKSWSDVVMDGCPLLPPSFIHYCIHSSHGCVLSEDSLFSESSLTSTKQGEKHEEGKCENVGVYKRGERETRGTGQKQGNGNTFTSAAELGGA